MTSGIEALLNRARKVREDLSLPDAARTESRRDHRVVAIEDPGIETSVTAALDWLGSAQDNSLSNDGGIARDYSLVSGWRASYPETSGYIVPTLLRGLPGRTNQVPRERARAVLDWLVSIQLDGGGFQGGVIGQTPVVPVTFNTGQILIGLASGVRELGDAYRAPMRRAADWLASTQDLDGAWRSHPTPFAKAGEKAYETHVAWGLLEAAREEPARGYAEAALRNIRWALTKQRANGWFADCCLNDASRPLTHTHWLCAAWTHRRLSILARRHAARRCPAHREGRDVGASLERIFAGAAQPELDRSRPMGVSHRLGADRTLLAASLSDHRRDDVRGRGASHECVSSRAQCACTANPR